MSNYTFDQSTNTYLIDGLIVDELTVQLLGIPAEIIVFKAVNKLYNRYSQHINERFNNVI